MQYSKKNLYKLTSKLAEIVSDPLYSLTSQIKAILICDMIRKHAVKNCVDLTSTLCLHLCLYGVCVCACVRVCVCVYGCPRLCVCPYKCKIVVCYFSTGTSWIIYSYHVCWCLYGQSIGNWCRTISIVSYYIQLHWVLIV